MQGTVLQNPSAKSNPCETCTVFQRTAGNMGRLEIILCGTDLFNYLIFNKNNVWHDMC
jgi:hypothetical protein